MGTGFNTWIRSAQIDRTSVSNPAGRPEFNKSLGEYQKVDDPVEQVNK